VTIPEGSRQ